MPQNKTKHIILNVTYFIVFFIALTPAITGDMMLLLEGYSLEALLMGIIATPIVILSLILLILEGYNLKLRYCLPNKQYKTLISNSIAKFNGAPEDFIKKYVKSRKDIFKKYGVIDNQDNSNWVYINKDGVKKATTLFNTLHNSIKSKGGLYDFCKNIFNHPDFEGGWEIYSYTTIDIVSTELKYLLKEIYLHNEYCIEDNGLSDSYTKINNEKIHTLNTVYTPLILNFESEIKELCKKLESKNKQKDKK